MEKTTIELKDLPPRFAEAVAAAGSVSELLIVDHNVPVARVIVCAGQARVPGLHAGTIQTSDDFDAPLPDGFWTGTP